MLHFRKWRKMEELFPPTSHLASLFLYNFFSYITFSSTEGKCHVHARNVQPSVLWQLFLPASGRGQWRKGYPSVLAMWRSVSSEEILQFTASAVLFSGVLSLTRSRIIILLSYYIGKSGRFRKVAWFGLSKLEPATACCRQHLVSCRKKWFLWLGLGSRFCFLLFFPFHLMEKDKWHPKKKKMRLFHKEWHCGLCWHD